MAARLAAVHLLVNSVLAIAVAILVFGLWYPWPYRDVSGGRELFYIVIAVDVICGPLLTLVIASPTKPRAELFRDLGLIAVIQIAALGYGVWTAWQARPLYLVHEIDRFKVIALSDVDRQSLSNLPANLKPKAYGQPLVLGLREPTKAERERVLFQSMQGGRDYAELPEFYKLYDQVSADKAIASSLPLDKFLAKYPNQQARIAALVEQMGIEQSALRLIPVMARGDWVAIVNAEGRILEFLPGDGFPGK